MATIQDLAKSVSFVQGIGAIDMAGAEKTCDYVNLALYDAITYVFNCGVITNTTIFTFTQCTEDLDAGSDIKALETATVQTLTQTTDDNAIKFTTITPDLLDLQGGFKWIYCTSTTHGATALVSVTMLGIRPRFSEATMPSMAV